MCYHGLIFVKNGISDEMINKNIQSQVLKSLIDKVLFFSDFARVIIQSTNDIQAIEFKALMIVSEYALQNPIGISCIPNIKVIKKPIDVIMGYILIESLSCFNFIQ